MTTGFISQVCVNKNFQAGANAFKNNKIQSLLVWFIVLTTDSVTVTVHMF